MHNMISRSNKIFRKLCRLTLLVGGLESFLIAPALGEIYFNNFTSQATVAANPASTSPSNESVDKLTDNVIKTSKWLVSNSTTATPYATFTFTNPQQLDAYTLVTGNDSADSRQPTAWTVYGSNDNGQNWTVVDQRTNFAQKSVDTPTLFYVNSGAAETTSYTQYRLSIDSWTNSSQNLMQISEFQMFSLQQGNRIGTGISTVTVVNNEGTITPAGDTETLFYANDGRQSTKFCANTGLSEENPVVVTYTFNNALDVAAYSLASANDFVGRTPSQWTLSGSNNGSDWTTLSSVNTLIGTTYFPLGESLASSASYSQYKLTITQTGKSRNTSGDGLQFSELALYSSDSVESNAIDLTRISNTKFTYTPSVVSTWKDGGAANAFDHNPATKWGLDVTTPSLDFSLGAEFALTSYTITAVNETNNLGRNPKSWTLYGEAEDGSWVALDSQENIAFYSGSDYTTLKTQTFTFSNEVAYKNYKLDITANNGSSNQFQLADLDFFTPLSSLAPTGKTMLELSRHPAVNITATTPGGWGTTLYIEGDSTTRVASNLTYAFDGRSQTKLCITNTNISPENPYAITFNFQDGLEFVLNEYTITTGNDEAGRDPANWAIYGSQDGST